MTFGSNDKFGLFSGGCVTCCGGGSCNQIIVLGAGAGSSIRCGASNTSSGAYTSVFGKLNTVSGCCSTVSGYGNNVCADCSSCHPISACSRGGPYVLTAGWSPCGAP